MSRFGACRNPAYQYIFSIVKALLYASFIFCRLPMIVIWPPNYILSVAENNFQQLVYSLVLIFKIKISHKALESGGGMILRRA